MKRWIKMISMTVLVIFLLVLGAVVWYLNKALPIGTGYAAKYLCSSTFISLRNPETVFEEDVRPVNPLANFIKYSINQEERSATATALWAKSTAVYWPDRGCVLLNGVSQDSFIQKVSQLKVRPVFTRGEPLDPTVPWPYGDKSLIDPQTLGLDAEQIDKAVDYAFSETNPDDPRNTRAILVAYDGNLIVERYAPGFRHEMPFLGWSMSKSITSALVGILVKKGLVDIYAPADVPEWQQPDDPRRNITLDQLLRMSSGLEFGEVYDPLYDATDMLYGAYDFAHFAAVKPLIHPPDSVWSYSSGTANIVARIVRRQAEKLYENYYDFLSDELFYKIGMFTATIEPDPSGTFVGSSYGIATARDWARFGQFYLQDGVWNGERILPEGWVDYTVTPTPKAPMGEYGAMFWLNAGALDDSSNRKWPDAPRDMFVAQGFQEQRVMIIPSKKLVIVRFGLSSREGWDSNEFLKLLLPAFSENK